MREGGYYFILRDGVTEVALWDQTQGWLSCGSDTALSDSYFDAIDERRIERHGIKGEDKFWRDVPQSHAGWKP